MRMFQQVQQLAKLNASLIERCNGAAAAGHSTGGDSLSMKLYIDASSPRSQPRSCEREEHVRRQYADPARQRLQALVIQQAQELKALHRKLESAIPLPPGCQVEESKLIFNRQLLGLTESSHSEPLLSSQGSTTSESFSYAQEQKRKRFQAHLRQLPLTSLTAQLKSKDTEILRLQQLATKLEAQVVAIVDKKREMARDYQQITRVQQLQLRKYFTLLRRLDTEKRAAVSKLVEVGEYVSVLERKLVASVDSKVLSHDAPGYSSCSIDKLMEPRTSHLRRTNGVHRQEKTRSSTADYAEKLI